MSVIVGFTILVMALLLGYMFYRLFLRRTIFILSSICMQLIALTVAVFSFVSDVNVLTSNYVESFYILFGVTIPGAFFVYDYTKMMKKIRNQGVYEGFVQALPKDAEQEYSIQLNKKFINPILKERQVSELVKYMNVNKDDIVKNIKKSLTQAQLMINAKDYENAYEVYNTLVKLIKNCPGLYFNYANICYQRENYVEASQAYKKVLEINEKLIREMNQPKEMDSEPIMEMLSNEDSIKHEEYSVYYNLGNTQFKMNKFEAAIDSYKKALDINPGLEEASENIARAMISLDRIPEALAYYQKVVEEDGKNYKVHYILGKLYSELKNYGEAERELREAIRLNKDCKEAYETLGVVLVRTQQPKESMEVFKKLIKLDPEDDRAHYSLGTAYYKTGEKEKAIEAFQRVIELKPENYKSHYNLAVALDEIGQQEEAIGAFRKVIEIKSDFIEAYNNLGIILSTQGRHLEALDVYIKGLRKNPDEYSLYYNMGITLSEMGKNSEAVDAYKNALEIKPDETEIYYHLGAAYTALNKYSNAVDAYKNALKVKTNDSELYYNIAVCYALLKKSDIAVDNLKKAIELKKEYREDARFNRAFDGLRGKEEFKVLLR